MKAVKLTLYVAFTVLLAASLGFAASGVFKTKLSGKEVVPPVETKATGYAQFKLSKDGKEITYILRMKDIDDVTAAHIHAGKKGESGAPVAGLFMGPKKEGKFSGVLAKGTVTDKNLVGKLAGETIGDLAKLIKDGEAYVNVHTVKNPNGEIRGQIK
ncbi:MAG TPA: CHRD domain-containing protein [Nitrospirota bacterium]|nr:CHRD domain-containing protein [Nitrospirota bacterium]